MGSAPALWVLRSCEQCGGRFRQQFGRGRPRKYCDQDCADIAKLLRRSTRPEQRFESKEAFWAWQRSPERRAEVGRKVAATKRAARGVIQQTQRVLEAATWTHS